MDLHKLFDFFDPYPSWFKVSAVLMIAAIAIGLLTLRQAKHEAVHDTRAEQAVNEVAASSPSVPSEENRSSSRDESIHMASIRDFYQRHDSLDGRFLEQQEFRQRVEGLKVFWEGYVANVSETKSKDTHPIFLILAERLDPRLNVVGVSLPEALRTKAYSLQRGDFVKFEGVVTSANGGTPYVNAESLEVVRRSSGG